MLTIVSKIGKPLKGLIKEQWLNNVCYIVEYNKPIIYNVHEYYEKLFKV